MKEELRHYKPYSRKKRMFGKCSSIEHTNQGTVIHKPTAPKSPHGHQTMSAILRFREHMSVPVMDVEGALNIFSS